MSFSNTPSHISRLFWGAGKLTILFTALLAGNYAYADCGWNSDRSFYGCKGVGYQNSVARTLPLVSDAVRFNPASLPTITTPIGIESIYNSKTTGGDSKFQVSLIKGLPYIGMGLSSWSEDSFATPNGLRYVREMHKNAYEEIPQASRTGFRVGGALGLPLGKTLSKYAKVNLGYSIGQGPKIGGIAKALGFTVDSGVFSLGYTRSTESLSASIPKTINDTYTAAITSGLFYAGISRIQYSIHEVVLVTGSEHVSKTNPFYIGSVRLSVSKVALYAAFKTGDSANSNKTSFAGSIQYKIVPKIVLSYLYGLYSAQHSVSLQIFL